PDGSRLFVNYQCGGPGGLGGGHDAIGVFDAVTGAYLTSIVGLANVGGGIVTDGNLIVAQGGDACIAPYYDHVGCPVDGAGITNVIDAVSLTPFAPLPNGNSFSFAPNHAFLIAGGNALQILDYQTRTMVQTIPIAASGLVAFAADGKQFYAPVPGENVLAVISVASAGADLGTPCGAGADCASTLCVDGVCCDGACGGGAADDCQACSVAKGATSNGTCTLLSAAQVCRASAGPCDVAETCTGTSADCPVDQVLSVPVPTTLASAQAGPLGIAVDGTSVYWTNGDDGTVMKVALSGGAPTTLASGQNTPRGIAVDGASVYWAAGNTVMKVALSGGAPTTLASSGQAGPSMGIAVDGTSVYWTNNAYSGTVMKVALSGGAPTTLASGQVAPTGITVDGTSVYWTNYGDSGLLNGAVMKVALSGGVPTTLASAQVHPADIAVDGTNMYWTNAGDPALLNSGTVMKVALSGGAATTLASGQARPNAIAVDGTSVYWTNYLTGNTDTVMKVALSGGVPTTLASAQAGPTGIAVDGTSVYWVNYHDDTVMKVPLAGAICAADGGTEVGPSPDTGPVGSPNGGRCTSGTTCASGHCSDGVCCDNACGGDDATDCQACSVATGATSNGTCAPLSSSHVCRASTGACDIAETCDGTSAACPANQLAPAGQVCRPLAGACDVTEKCSGGTADCPPDAFAAIGTVCHTGTAPCESTEVCTGDAICPPASPPPPSCNFMVKYTGTRLLMANANGTATPGKRRDDTRTTSAPSTVQITETSPFNNSHNADAFSVVDQGATMTVSTRLAGVAALGRLSGTVQSESSTDIMSSVNPTTTFGRGLETMEWWDEVTVTSPTLPAGTGVQFLAQLDLDSQLGNVGGEVVPAQPAEPAYATATAVVGGTTVLTLTDRITQPLVTRSTTAQVNTRVGDKLVLNGRLQVYAMARLKLQTPVRVTADAGHTAIVRLIPVTSGASYVTASGRGPYVRDATPPVVTIDSPAAGAVVRGAVPVVISARDNASGVARIEAWAATVRLGECRASSCTLNLDTRTLPDGPLSLRATAWDFEGNAAAESRRQLIVDNTPPVFSNVPKSRLIAFATSTAGAKVTYAKPTASDARDGTVAVACVRAPGAQFPVNTTPVTCTATDTRGNTSAATFTVWVQYQAPTDGTFFLRPIRPNGSSIFQIGRPVPVRFKLTGASAGITNLVARLLVTKISNSVEGTAEDTSDETVDDSDMIFKYRSPLTLYAYRWPTRGETQGTFQLRADLGDGVVHQANVSLKAAR
ncbi:MAG TPA: HYR domain-containing protein, partial [Polyangia bacterium]|nr:HYR domain-containing protein [Polyangia bacterium]